MKRPLRCYCKAFARTRRGPMPHAHARPGVGRPQVHHAMAHAMSRVSSIMHAVQRWMRLSL